VAPPPVRSPLKPPYNARSFGVPAPNIERTVAKLDTGGSGAASGREKPVYELRVSRAQRM